MNFTKMHGIGNDYIYIDAMKEQIDNPSALSVVLSDRHTGIGGDGIILVGNNGSHYFMDIYNADGSRGKMCGNGIRCVGKFLCDKGYVSGNEVDIDSLSGTKHLVLKRDGNGECVGAVVDMGAPVIDENLTEIEVLGSNYDITSVSMGNPHCVIFTEKNVDELELEKIGPYFEHHNAFPEGVNTEFVNIIDKNTLKMRVWERGSGETMACGTGACAVAAAAFHHGISGREVTVKLRGGDLKITRSEKPDTIFMEGPATSVFEGKVNVEKFGL